jgi:hypothetical protein
MPYYVTNLVIDARTVNVAEAVLIIVTEYASIPLVPPDVGVCDAQRVVRPVAVPSIVIPVR